MASLADITVIGDMLQFIGVFVSFSIAYVAFRGVRKTESSSLLRLATAFVFLGFGFMVEGLAGLSQISPIVLISGSTVVLAGLVLETTGYFFLAFSHAIDVMLSKRLGAALMVFPLITLSGTTLSEVLGILSFYFLLYGVVETLYSYARTKKPDTLLIAGGLAMIGVGTFVQLLSPLYLQVDIVSQILLLGQIILKVMGLMMLFVPVLSFAVGVKR